MKVLCINAGHLESDIFCEEDDFLKEGETYTVCDAFIDCGYCWYVLEEHPAGDEFGYDSQRFCNLTEIDKYVIEAQEIANKKKTWYQKIFT
jgi:hypothetical protein